MRSRRLVEVARLKRAMGGFFCCPQDGTVPVLYGRVRYGTRVEGECGYRTI